MSKMEFIKVQIDSHPESGVEFLPDVLRQLNAMVRLLTDIATRDSRVEVVEIRKASPLVASLRVASIEETPKSLTVKPFRPRVKRTSVPFRRLERAYQEAKSDKRVKKPDVLGMVALQDFAKQLRGDIATIYTSKAHMVIDPSIIAQIQGHLGEIRRSRGTITGILEGINVHTRPWSFTIYPEVGPSRVKCTFGEDQFEQVQHAIRKIVTVHGLKEFVADSPWPLKLAADEVEIREEALPGAWLSLVDNLQMVWDQAEEDERFMIMEGVL